MADYNLLIKNTINDVKNEIFIFENRLNMENKDKRLNMENKIFSNLENIKINFNSIWTENEDMW